MLPALLKCDLSNQSSLTPFRLCHNLCPVTLAVLPAWVFLLLRPGRGLALFPSWQEADESRRTALAIWREAEAKSTSGTRTNCQWKNGFDVKDNKNIKVLEETRGHFIYSIGVEGFSNCNRILKLQKIHDNNSAWKIPKGVCVWGCLQIVSVRKR